MTDVNCGDIREMNDSTGKEYRRNVIHLKRVETGERAVVNKNEENATLPDSFIFVNKEGM